MMSDRARRPASPFFRLVLECLHFRRLLAISILALAGQALAALALTWLLKRWLEGPFLGGDTSALLEILGQALEVTLGLVVLLFVSRYAVAGLNQRLLERLRDAAVAKLLRASVSS